MHHFLLLAISAAALALAAFPASAQRRCSGTAEPVVRLDFTPSRPAVDTLPMAELRRLSRDGLGEHQHTLGLYKAELRSSMRLEYAISNDGRNACIGIREVRIALQLADRRIYLARELQRGSCRHDVTLAHEQLHARIDDTIFSRELPNLKQALARAALDIGVVGPIPAGNVPSYRDDIGERVERIFRQELDRISETRRREQGSIDTPEAYRREAARCPGE
ncbi:MAG TPA: hypothetical protein VHM01_13220 [Alphaproteobacteria bacterium]|nr:hypothetical protein [Alphaproteobacteria bacterium]